jgi:pimeloyl-CoA synthetase
MKLIYKSHNTTKRYNFEVRANNKTWNVQGNIEHSRITEALAIAQNVFAIYDEVTIIDNDTGEVLVLIAPDD